jgi:uncharacterized protein (TIGR02246 family)
MVRTIGAAVVALVAAVGFAGLSQGQGKTDPALDKLAKEFVVAFNAKDAAKVAGFYADDAVLMPPGHPLVKGRAAIQAYYADEFKKADLVLQLRPTASAITGSSAYEAGTTLVVVKVGGSSMKEAGKYLVVYKQVGSDWKLAYDIFNADQPPPPPPPAPAKK